VIWGSDPHCARFIVATTNGWVVASGRNDDGNYDEGEPSKEYGKVENGYELSTTKKCKIVDYKEEREGC